MRDRGFCGLCGYALSDKEQSGLVRGSTISHQGNNFAHWAAPSKLHIHPGKTLFAIVVSPM